MHWLAILSAVKSLLASIWKPVAAVLFARQVARTRDLKNANEVRRRAQVTEEKHRENVTRIDDDALDRRLRELRSRD